MAIGALVHQSSAAEQVLVPLHQKGCKITMGAGITLPIPTLRHALLLVANRRASSRILKPIAVERIQRAWVKHLEKRTATAQIKAALALEQASAAVILQSAWRRYLAVTAKRIEEEAMRAAQAVLIEKRKAAAVSIQSCVRGQGQRRLYHRRLAEINGPLARIQAAFRGWAARKQLKVTRRAANRIASTWRRVRCQVLRARLARAANALRQGGKLAKYRKHHGKRNHERHERFAWVSEDLQCFLWAPAADQAHRKLRSIPMSSITAVTDGVKTPLLKKMEHRATETHRHIPFSHKKPLAIDESCAFSIICRERVVDFYAADLKSRNAWLRDLRTVLSHAHTYDHKAAMAAVQRLTAESAAKASDSDTDED